MNLRTLLSSLPAEGLSYEEEKKVSAEIDQRLGFRYSAETSSERTETAQTWSHLSPQVFQTPYPELHRIILQVDPDSKAKNWVDLGAAYGRLGLLLAVYRTEANFTGIEVLSERVHEAHRVYKIHSVPYEGMRTGDCARDSLPRADVYFIYDFGHESDVNAALEKLREHAREQGIRVVGRGRRVRDLIEKHHPWLGSVHRPIHGPHYSIYRSDAEESATEE